MQESQVTPFTENIKLPLQKDTLDLAFRAGIWLHTLPPSPHPRCPNFNPSPQWLNDLASAPTNKLHPDSFSTSFWTSSHERNRIFSLRIIWLRFWPYFFFKELLANWCPDAGIAFVKAEESPSKIVAGSDSGHQRRRKRSRRRDRIVQGWDP